MLITPNNAKNHSIISTIINIFKPDFKKDGIGILLIIQRTTPMAISVTITEIGVIKILLKVTLLELRSMP